MEFGNRLYELRKGRGMSQEDLAAALEVTRQTVSKWEVGDSTPDMAKLAALAELFGVSLDFLVLGKITVTGKLDALGEKVLAPENGRRMKRGLRMAALVFGAVLAVDAVSFAVYVLIWGLPG